MIPEELPIKRGMVVRHDEGLLYQVEDTRPSTAGYETTHQVGSLTINYTQLEDGEYPLGTRWNKDEEGFRKHFTVDNSVDTNPDLREPFIEISEILMSIHEQRRFSQLRLEVQSAVEKEITDRVLNNPIPDKEEVYLGVFKEQIEPQCRDAVFELQRKGYRTYDSGFASVEIDGIRMSGRGQYIYGDFSALDRATIAKIQEMGAEISDHNISFNPPRADLGEITRYWNQLVALLPDKGKRAEPFLRRKRDFYRAVKRETPWIDWSAVDLTTK